MNTIEIILSLPDMFDYDEYTKACLKSGVEPFRIGDYAQRVGILRVAMYRFKGVSADKAYTAFIMEMNKVAQEKKQQKSSTTGGCSGCGKK